MTHNKLPSDEDFRRASASIKRRSRGLSNVRERIKYRFCDREVLHEFFILDCSEYSFRAYVFYRWDRQIAEAEESGLESKIVDCVFEELEKAGRGARNKVKVEFEFDSHENIERNYEGDYFMRLKEDGTMSKT